MISLQAIHPERYIECFIAEQNLVGVAIGCATRDRSVAFCSTFAAFFTRAFDQLRMGAISQTNLNCAGSHAGISIGKQSYYHESCYFSLFNMLQKDNLKHNTCKSKQVKLPHLLNHFPE